MTRRFDFDSYKITFNDFQFRGDGHLIGIPQSSDEMYEGRVMLAVRPHELSFNWLNELVRQGNVRIDGTIEDGDGSLIKLHNGEFKSYSAFPPSSGFHIFQFAFETIQPPL